MSTSTRTVPVPTLDPSMSPSTRVGIDLVQVAAIERSIADFGTRFTHRLFAERELRESTVDGRLDARALAQRFAAKEATIKAFELSEAGVGWSQIEVVGNGGPAARVRLHGRAAASAAHAGAYEIAAALSSDGDLACAIVVARPRHDGNAAREGGCAMPATRDEDAQVAQDGTGAARHRHAQRDRTGPAP